MSTKVNAPRYTYALLAKKDFSDEPVEREGTEQNPPDFSDLGITVEVKHETFEDQGGIRGVVHDVYANGHLLHGGSYLEEPNAWTDVGGGWLMAIRPVVGAAPLPWEPVHDVSCADCFYNDKRRGREEYLKQTHVFENGVCQMWKDVGELEADARGLPSPDPDRVGLCTKHRALVDDSTLGCGLYVERKRDDEEGVRRGRSEGEAREDDGGGAPPAGGPVEVPHHRPK